MRVLIVIATLWLSACFDPHPENGTLRCSEGSSACPDGYQCELTSRTCWRVGDAPDLGSSDGAVAADAAQIDADPPDLTPEADLLPERRHQGEACTPGGPACDTGHCVDGVCCDGACTEQCRACNIDGALGTCTVIPPGLPRGGRATCNGSGACGGTCNGTSATCSYPTAGTICGASCNGQCDGAGACSAAGGACPGGYVCEATSCRTNCTSSAHCQPNFTCSSNACVRIPESDCLDGVDNNGDGLADCMDPTCTAKTQCVAEVPNGDELGVLTTGSCPSGWGASAHYNQQPIIPTSCSGCGCSATLTCSYRASLYGSGTNCNGLGSLLGTMTLGDLCVDRASANNGVGAIALSATATSMCSSSSGGARPTAITKWTLGRSFCSAPRFSKTCAVANQVCAPKLTTPPLCVRIPMANAACPAGYTSGASSTWYADGTTFNDTRTCSCSCTAAPGNCNASTVSVNVNGSSCATPPGGIGTPLPTWPANDSSICMQHDSTALVRSIRLGGYPGAANTTCTSSGTAMGTATPLGGSTICCQ